MACAWWRVASGRAAASEQQQLGGDLERGTRSEKPLAILHRPIALQLRSAQMWTAQLTRSPAALTFCPRRIVHRITHVAARREHSTASTVHCCCASSSAVRLRCLCSACRSAASRGECDRVLPARMSAKAAASYSEDGGQYEEEEEYDEQGEGGGSSVRDEFVDTYTKIPHTHCTARTQPRPMQRSADGLSARSALCLLPACPPLCDALCVQLPS